MRVRRRFPMPAAAAAVVLAMTVLLSACATGHDANVGGGGFEFVAPGGKTTIKYAAAKRQTLPDIHGESLADPGKEIRVSDYPGKVIVLNIWGSWCGPCRSEAPQLEKVVRQTRDDGVRVIGIDVREHSRSAPRDFVANHGISYPSIYSPSGRALLPLNGYPRTVVPSTIVLDRKHRVAAVYLKPLLASDLLPELRKLIATPH